MARKSYTEEDRARVRQALLDTGLEMAVNKGLGGLHLAAWSGSSRPESFSPRTARSLYAHPSSRVMR